MNKRAAALNNAKAIDARMKRLEGQLPYATGKARTQITAQLRRLRAARSAALNF